MRNCSKLWHQTFVWMEFSGLFALTHLWTWGPLACWDLSGLIKIFLAKFTVTRCWDLSDLSRRLSCKVPDLKSPSSSCRLEGAERRFWEEMCTASQTSTRTWLWDTSEQITPSRSTLTERLGHLHVTLSRCKIIVNHSFRLENEGNKCLIQHRANIFDQIFIKYL